jgi:hypothetical protein
MPCVCAIAVDGAVSVDEVVTRVAHHLGLGLH